jgi:hypothetical protein
MSLIAILEKLYTEYFIFVVVLLYGIAITQSYRLAKFIIKDCTHFSNPKKVSKTSIK